MINKTEIFHKDIPRREFIFSSIPKISLGALGLALGFETFQNRNDILDSLFKKRILDVQGEGHNYHCIFLAHGDNQLGFPGDMFLAKDINEENITIVETGLSEYLGTSYVGSNTYMPTGGRVLWAWDLDTQDSFHQVSSEVCNGGGTIVMNDLLTESVLLGSGADATMLLGGAFISSKMKRRSFFKGVLMGVAAYGATGLSPEVIAAGSQFVPDDTAQALAKLNVFVDVAHPESIAKGFREAVVAAKSLDLKQDANMVYGSVHWTIPFYLQSGREAIYEFLQTYPRAFVDTFVTNKQTLYTSAILHRDEKGKYIQKETLHPELQEMFT